MNKRGRSKLCKTDDRDIRMRTVFNRFVWPLFHSSSNEPTARQIGPYDSTEELDLIGYSVVVIIVIFFY